MKKVMELLKESEIGEEMKNIETLEEDMKEIKELLKVFQEKEESKNGEHEEGE